VLELDAGLEFQPENDEEFFSLLPEGQAVCLIEPRAEKAEPHLIRTANLQRRLQRLLGPGDPTSKRLNLREFARQVRYRATNSAFEQSLTYYRIARQIFPKKYRDLMRLRPAPLLKINLKNAYPRCYVTRHIAVDDQGLPAGGVYYGPFPSAAPRRVLRTASWIFSRCAAARSRFAAIPHFPGASIRR